MAKMVEPKKTVEPTKMVEPDNDDIGIEEDCEACNGSATCQLCSGNDEDCEECEGSGDCQGCDGSGTAS